MVFLCAPELVPTHTKIVANQWGEKRTKIAVEAALRKAGIPFTRIDLTPIDPVFPEAKKAASLNYTVEVYGAKEYQQQIRNILAGFPKPI